VNRNEHSHSEWPNGRLAEAGHNPNVGHGVLLGIALLCPTYVRLANSPRECSDTLPSNATLMVELAERLF
jgi:hypothetical protein